MFERLKGLFGLDDVARETVIDGPADAPSGGGFTEELARRERQEREIKRQRTIEKMARDPASDLVVEANELPTEPTSDTETLERAAERATHRKMKLTGADREESRPDWAMSAAERREAREREPEREPEPEPEQEQESRRADQLRERDDERMATFDEPESEPEKSVERSPKMPFHEDIRERERKEREAESEPEPERGFY